MGLSPIASSLIFERRQAAQPGDADLSKALRSVVRPPIRGDLGDGTRACLPRGPSIV